MRATKEEVLQACAYDGLQAGASSTIPQSDVAAELVGGGQPELTAELGGIRSWSPAKPTGVYESASGLYKRVYYKSVHTVGSATSEGARPVDLTGRGRRCRHRSYGDMQGCIAGLVDTTACSRRPHVAYGKLALSLCRIYSRP